MNVRFSVDMINHLHMTASRMRFQFFFSMLENQQHHINILILENEYHEIYLIEHCLPSHFSYIMYKIHIKFEEMSVKRVAIMKMI